jgi:hypothetical protein
LPGVVGDAKHLEVSPDPPGCRGFKPHWTLHEIITDKTNVTDMVAFVLLREVIIPVVELIMNVLELIDVMRCVEIVRFLKILL